MAPRRRRESTPPSEDHDRKRRRSSSAESASPPPRLAIRHRSLSNQPSSNTDSDDLSRSQPRPRALRARHPNSDANLLRGPVSRATFRGNQSSGPVAHSTDSSSPEDSSDSEAGEEVDGGDGGGNQLKGAPGSVAVTPSDTSSRADGDDVRGLSEESGDERESMGASLSEAGSAQGQISSGEEGEARGQEADEDDLEEEEAWEEWEKWAWDIRQGLGYLRKLGQNRWIVQGWDIEHSLFSDKWFHFDYDPIPALSSCDCTPSPVPNCVHSLAYRHEPEIFHAAPSLTQKIPLPPVVSFSALPKFDHGFSVQQTMGEHDSGKRVVVTVRGSRTWNCSLKRCRRQDCQHIEMARKRARELRLLPDSDNEELGDGGARGNRGGNNDDNQEEEEEEEEERSEKDRHGGEREKNYRELAVSAAKRGPPASLRLDNDHDQSYPLYRSLPKHRLPRILELDEHSRCRFGHKLESFSRENRAALEVTTSSYRVLTREGVRKVQIQTVKCPRCRRRIGPDLLEHGLFNWNNETGFAREIFDDYISELSLSQTTIHAFHRIMVESFCSEPTFRRAFFAFLRVLAMDSGMECKECGNQPEIVICDGSVIGFEKKRLSGNIRMPTLPTSDSFEKPDVKAFPLSALSTATLGAERIVVEKIRKLSHAWSKDKRAELPFALSEVIIQGLVLEEPFAQAFASFVLAIADNSNTSKERTVLKELLSQIVAKHSMFFVTPVVAFDELDNFARTGDTTPELRRMVPILGKLHQFGRNEAVCELFKALTVHARDSYARLVANAAVQRRPSPITQELIEAKEQSHPDLGDPIQIGSFYGAAKRRSRNLYPGLKDDAGQKRLVDKPVKDSDEPQESCQKRFDLFGAKGLVGGICGTWCTHGICVGAHIMPSAEGRDDIFSALFCHWEKAPSHVIYDYSCQLALYSQRREPEFFKDTRFWIDELHARGHTDCSSACYFSALARENPELQYVNTSIAEASHSTIGRIRKSVSYMNEIHAKLFLWVTINAHNRRKLLDLLFVERCPEVLEDQNTEDELD